MNSTLAYFTARAAQLPSDEDIRLERLPASGGDRFAVAFSASSVQELIWTVPQIPTSYQGGNLFVDLHCAMATATSGTVGISAAIEASSSIEIDETSFDTANAISSAVPSTAGETFTVTIALTNFDSLAVGDAVRVKIARVLSGATATGALYILGGVFYESIDTVTLDGDLVANSLNVTGDITGDQLTLGDGSHLQFLSDGTILAGSSFGNSGDVLTSNGTGVGVAWTAPVVVPTTTNILVGDGAGQIGDSGYALPLDFADLTGTGTVAEISGVAAGDLLMSSDGATGITSTGFLAPDQDLRTDQDVTFNTVTATGVGNEFAGLVVSGSQSIVGTLYVDTLSVSDAGGGSPAYTFPTTDGTDGQVLTTDGAGAVTWENVGTDFSGFPEGSVVYVEGGVPTYHETLTVNTNGHLRADVIGLEPTPDTGTGLIFMSGGQIYVRGNGEYGTEGQVLTSHGNASVTWENAANPFDQDLNVADNVRFNQCDVTAGDGNGFNILADGRFYASTSGFGTDGQVFTSHGDSAPAAWENAANPFDQDLNVGDSPTFVAIHISTLYDLNDTLGGDGQVLTSDGASCVWADAVNPFDQDLNVADSPTFNNVSVTTFDAASSNVTIDASGNVIVLGNFDVGTGATHIGLLTDGTIQLNADVGTAGQVLTSGGSGAPVAWADPTTANPFDQDLNVGDSPTFAEITSAGNINAVDCYLDASIFLGGNLYDMNNSAGDAGQVLTALGGAAGCTWQDVPNFLDQLVWNEIPSGTIDGGNDSFTLVGTPVTGKLLLFKNGVLQQEGVGNDYVLSSSTITFEAGAIPQSGDILLATYQT